MDRDYIVKHLVQLRDMWYGFTDKYDEFIWGECAHELDILIEKIADER